MRQASFHFTSVIFLKTYDSFSDCPYPLDDFVRTQFMHTFHVIVVNSSFTMTFISPVLGFLVLYDGCSSVSSNECCDDCLVFCSLMLFTALTVAHSQVLFWNVNGRCLWLPSLLWCFIFILALGNLICYLVAVVMQQVQVKVQHLHFCPPPPPASLISDQSWPNCMLQPLQSWRPPS